MLKVEADVVVAGPVDDVAKLAIGDFMNFSVCFCRNENADDCKKNIKVLLSSKIGDAMTLRNLLAVVAVAVDLD